MPKERVGSTVGRKVQSSSYVPVFERRVSENAICAIVPRPYQGEMRMNGKSAAIGASRGVGICGEQFVTDGEVDNAESQQELDWQSPNA